MKNSHKNIIRIAIVIKFLVLGAFSISVFAVIYEQYILTNSNFPENNQMAADGGDVVYYITLSLIPLALSIIVDFKERMKAVLKAKWYFLNFGLIVLYLVANQLKNQHYVILPIAALLTLFFVLAIQKQNHGN